MTPRAEAGTTKKPVKFTASKASRDDNNAGHDDDDAAADDPRKVVTFSMGERGLTGDKDEPVMIILSGRTNRRRRQRVQQLE